MSGSFLSNLRGRLAGWLAVRVVLLVAGAAGALAFGAVVADAALDLPEAARAAAPAGLAVMLLGVLAAGGFQFRRLSAMRMARGFEARHSMLGNRLTNAVQLALQTSESPTTEYLRQQAIELGRAAACSLKAWPAARAAVLGAAAVVAGAGLCSAGLALYGGDVLRAVGPRFLDPRGDHPPYSRLSIDVKPRGGQVLYGGQLDIRAIPSGRPVDKLWLVARSGTNLTRTVMFLAPDKSFFQTLANVREPAEYYVTDGAARSRRFSVSVRMTPQITMVEATATFPEYTRLPARTAKLAEEPQSLPQGTRLLFRVASNRPLRSGTLTVTPLLGGGALEVALKPEPGLHMVSGGFVLTQAAAFALSVRDTDGTASLEPKQGRLHILPDERPRLFVLEPGRDAVATPSFTVPVHVQATDDYGVTRVAWLRGHNRSAERPVALKLDLKDGSRGVEARSAFELGRLGVRPGDVIEYYFEAADNDPKGPNVALSKVYRLEIISEEQYGAMLRQAAARKALFEPYLRLNAWLRRLAESARVAEDKASKNDPAASAAAKELAAQLEEFYRDLGKLLASPAMFDIEQAFRTALVAQHQAVAQLKNQARQAAAGPTSPREMEALARALEKLSKANDQEVGAPASHIASVAALVSRANQFVKLAREQAMLARMLQRFAEKTGGLTRIEQMEVQELAHQERRIRDALAGLVESFPALLAQVPEDPQYDLLREDVKGFLDAVVREKIQDDLAGAAKALAELDAMTGRALALASAEKMERLVGQCRGQQQNGQQCLEARFKPTISGAGESLRQILAAMGAGSEGSGEDGYSMFSNDVGLYGANMQLAGDQGGPRGSGPGGRGQGGERVAGDGSDGPVGRPEGPARVRLQPDARFPLRYRDLAGEYFRAIAESAAEEGAKR